VHRLTQRVALLLQEGQQQGSIPAHLDPLKTAQVFSRFFSQIRIVFRPSSFAPFSTCKAQCEPKVAMAFKTTK